VAVEDRIKGVREKEKEEKKRERAEETARNRKKKADADNDGAGLGFACGVGKKKMRECGFGWRRRHGNFDFTGMVEGPQKLCVPLRAVSTGLASPAVCAPQYSTTLHTVRA
jgi:hypothetical protein